jgi:hypothetical protein
MNFLIVQECDEAIYSWTRRCEVNSPTFAPSFLNLWASFPANITNNRIDQFLPHDIIMSINKKLRTNTKKCARLSRDSSW